jgi:hypothetical protein
VSNVHEIKRTSWLDVPGKLRDLAAHIEAEGNKVRTIIVISSDGETVTVRGFGERTSPVEISGYFARAQWIQNYTPITQSIDPDPPAA